MPDQKKKLSEEQLTSHAACMHNRPGIDLHQNSETDGR